MGRDLHEPLQQLCAEHGLTALYVLGSRADEISGRVAGVQTKTAHPASDVDIGALPKHGRDLPAAERVRLMQQLEALLDASRVDLVILPEANAFLAADLAPFLREHWRETAGATCEPFQGEGGGGLAHHGARRRYAARHRRAATRQPHRRHPGRARRSGGGAVRAARWGRCSTSAVTSSREGAGAGRSRVQTGRRRSALS